MTPRRATPDDAAGLTQLRLIMHQAVKPHCGLDWMPACEAAFARALAEQESMAVFVVDHPDGPGLIASAMGVWHPSLPGPTTTAMRSGEIGSVATDPDHRRRGHARACVAAARDWLVDEGCERVRLTPAPDATALYAALGFAPRDT
ncbi:GNAT family N-acetyltransferase, partial [Streptacidiphilus jiangxiensis]